MSLSFVQHRAQQLHKVTVDLCSAITIDETSNGAEYETLQLRTFSGRVEIKTDRAQLLGYANKYSGSEFQSVGLAEAKVYESQAYQ